VDWMIAAQTPFPRLRADNNLVIPEDKLPKPPVAEQPVEEEANTEIFTYICANSSETEFKPGVKTAGEATRFTTINRESTPACSDPYTKARFI